MAALTKKERVRAALAGEAVDRVPVSLWGHDFLREWEPQELVAATLDAYRPYEWDFIKFNPRFTYFAEAWGNRYERPADQRQPRLLDPAVHAPGDLAHLQPVDAQGGVFGEHLTALRLLLAEVGAEVDVVHTIFSPLGVAATLCRDNEEFRQFALTEPAAAHAGLAAITETLARYAEAALEVGAAGIFFAPLRWASHETCNEDFYREFGRSYDLQILARVQAAPFNILHVCRNDNMIDLLLDYPVAALNWADHGEGNPSLSDMRSRTDKALMGGLDQARLHEMSPAQSTDQAREALTVGPTGLFLAPGCAISPQTPAATRAAAAAAVR